tara:strand:+ start:2796 stop:3545 length:750 start_codon:yes stop_codon:yes gene_type:complete
MVENKNDWKIWDRDDSVEQRTYKRVKNELPEMECAKQLAKIMSKIYAPEMKVLDMGCAAGHYYNTLNKIDSKIKYCGIDSTKKYIDFAKSHFKNNKNVNFILGDIFNLPESMINQFDITFCCNVLLHLPSLEVPLKNLVKSSKKYCIIRTLASDKTHLSKFLYNDELDKKGHPINFVHQNTYSFELIKKIILSLGKFKIEFIEDEFNETQINKEFNKFDKVQSAVTQVVNDIQIAGSKVFQWKWVIVTK